MSAFQSVDKTKAYQIIRGSIIMLTLPIAFILLKFGFQAY